MIWINVIDDQKLITFNIPARSIILPYKVIGHRMNIMGYIMFDGLMIKMGCDIVDPSCCDKVQLSKEGKRKF